ncbi:MAG: phosphoribosylformylglycinamidine synthase subunit PurQ [Bacteroidetes bacterium]|nr:MAG: phosphoribosylformylglycinamidine synthase subunit PurQ [Bacteroidota bacterium]
MKFGVIVFPGSNCDDDMVYLLRETLGQQVIKLWHKDTNLQGCDFVIVPGGFSYGDYLRSGAIARFSPIMPEVQRHAERGGYVLGICNGFQILTEAGLLQGALLKNTNRKYICKNVFLRSETAHSLLTRNLPASSIYKIPIAHGDGRYYADSPTLASMQDNDQIVFRYCTEAGKVEEEANPNGSLDNIAGICNKGRNVFGMMPHPERASEALLGNEDGLKMFQAILG